VAEGIVNQHGGTITASNRAEGGACLEVTLPASRSAEQERIQLAIKRTSSRNRLPGKPGSNDAGWWRLRFSTTIPDFCNYLEDALKDDGLYAIRTFAHPDELFAACELSACPTSFCST
jgi:hypothetical protein